MVEANLPRLLSVSEANRCICNITCRAGCTSGRTIDGLLQHRLRTHGQLQNLLSYAQLLSLITREGKLPENLELLTLLNHARILVREIV